MTTCFMLLCLVFTKLCFGDDFSIVSGVLDDQYGDVLAAFGDFNADKLIDIFVICHSGRGVDVLLAQDKKQYERKVLLTNETIPHGSIISGIMAADFDGDLYMDILVSTKNLLNPDDGVRAALFWGNGTGLNTGDYYRFENESFKDEPILFDYNADMIPDVLTETSTGSLNEVWEAIPNGRNFSRFMFPTHFSLQVPHSSAFVDLDKDYYADLLVTNANNTFIVFSDNDFTNSTTFEFDIQDLTLVGQSSFADFNQDGCIDHVVPACKRSNGNDCQQSVIYIRDGKNKTQWLLASELPSGWQFSSMPSSQASFVSSLNIPLTLRVGDYDMDGYPDLLTVLNSKDGLKPFLLRNVLNSSGDGRWFELQRTPLPTNTNSTLLATFYDYGEDGMPDVLVTAIASNGEPYSILLKNNLALDTCFLKVTVISGLCSDNCKNGRKPYGVNVPGPTVFYKTTQTNGNTQTNSAGQLSQSAHFALQLPFVSFGLGQTPNFIDELVIGIPQLRQNIPKVKRYKEWQQMIPNAQLIVNPYPHDDTSSWRMQLFVVPSQQIYFTGIALLSTCVILALIVGILLWNERREDKQEKKNESQKFHFDAM